MQKIILVLACIARAGHAQRVQYPRGPMDQNQALAKLLLAADSASAFNAASRGVHAIRSNSRVARSSPMMVEAGKPFSTGRRAIVGAALAAMLAAQPAFGGIPEAAKDFTDAAYPLIGSLKKDTVAPLTSKAVEVALTASPQEIIKTIDAGLDAFLSTNPEKFISTAKVLKEATAEASKATNCNLLCLPSLETSEKVGAAAADALSTADPAKVSAFANQAIKAFNSVDKFKLAPVLLDGGKFAASLNPKDVAAATAAALEVAKASGAVPR
mmetsp:Transcript_16412/g.30192  ORF Transcript_16412/g.30192 Transcript_16412/m.30192 type:complete len:270 (-) Transcript_16412:201-1010(-)